MKVNAEIHRPGNKYYYESEKYLNYEVLGNGNQTILFIHGFGASLKTWVDLTDNLDKNKYRLVLLDLKGFGYSSKPRDGDYTIKDNAFLVEGFIKHLDLKNYYIVGHSMGGGVALLLIINNLTNSEFLPTGMILIDAAAYDTQLPFFVKILRIPIISPGIYWLTTHRYKTRYTLEKIYYDKSKISDVIISRYTYYMDEPGYSYALIETAKDIRDINMTEYTSKYKDINIPTLILWGANDTAIKIENGHKLKEALECSILQIIDECGHNPQEEKPDITATHIIEFIESQVRCDEN